MVQTPSRTDRKSWTILVVDDEEGVRSVTTSLLAGRGYDVLEASNGYEALHIFSTLLESSRSGYVGLFCGISLEIGGQYKSALRLYDQLRNQLQAGPFIAHSRYHVMEDYIKYRTALVDAMVKAGGSPSHHHGVGRLMHQWIEGFLGKNEMDVLRALKNHFDPNNIMNPGSQLGLHVPDELKR